MVTIKIDEIGGMGIHSEGCHAQLPAGVPCWPAQTHAPGLNCRVQRVGLALLGEKVMRGGENHKSFAILGCDEQRGSEGIASGIEPTVRVDGSGYGGRRDMNGIYGEDLLQFNDDASCHEVGALAACGGQFNPMARDADRSVVVGGRSRERPIPLFQLTGIIRAQAARKGRFKRARPARTGRLVSRRLIDLTVAVVVYAVADLLCRPCVGVAQRRASVNATR